VVLEHCLLSSLGPEYDLQVRSAVHSFERSRDFWCRYLQYVSMDTRLQVSGYSENLLQRSATAVVRFLREGRYSSPQYRHRSHKAYDRAAHMTLCPSNPLAIRCNYGDL